MSQVLTVIIALLTVFAILFSKLLFCAYIRRLTHRVLRKHGLTLEDIKYSFDSMIYTISLPNHNPTIENAAKVEFKAKLEWGSWLYPELIGLKVTLKNEGGETAIAFLDLDQFRLPVIDQLLIEKKITARTYTMICAYKLMDKDTREAARDEVYKQIHKLPYTPVKV